LLNTSEMPAQPWKSGTSVPRKLLKINVGFSPVVVFLGQLSF